MYIYFTVQHVTNNAMKKTDIRPPIYIYIYMYFLIKYLPVFTVPEKNKKNLARNKRKKYLESRSRGKRKKSFG